MSDLVLVKCMVSQPSPPSTLQENEKDAEVASGSAAAKIKKGSKSSHTLANASPLPAIEEDDVWDLDGEISKQEYLEYTIEPEAPAVPRHSLRLHKKNELAQQVGRF